MWHLKPDDLLPAHNRQKDVQSEERHGGKEECINDGVDGVGCRLQCHDVRTKEDEQQ